LRDKVIGVRWTLAPGAFDVRLAFPVELLERESWTSPSHDPLPQGRGAQRVLYGIVVHLAKQHDAVALHRLHQCARIRVELDRRRSGGGSGGEPKQAGGNLQTTHFVTQSVCSGHAW
jgi:hypothetical protein